MIRKAVAVVAAALLVGGCAQTSVGVAARVGDDAIETSRLAGLVNRAFEDETFSRQPRDQFQLRVLANLITRHLVEVAAHRRGVKATDAAVETEFKALVEQTGSEENLYAAAAAQGVAKPDLRRAIHDSVLQDLLMDDLVKDMTVTDAQLRAQYDKLLPQLDTAEVAHILIRDPKKARDVAAQAKKPGADFAALAVRNSEDTETSAAGGGLGAIGNGQGRFSDEFEKAVFSAKTGDVVGPVKTVTQGDAKVVQYEIIKVIKRTTRTFAQAREDVRRSLLDAERQRRFTSLVEDLSKELGVSVNPRFGRWDAQRRQIVPADPNTLSSPGPLPGQAPLGVPPGPVGTPAPPAP